MCDFIDMVKEEESHEAIKILYDMLTTPNPKIPFHDKELNDLAAPFVKRELDERFDKDV